MKLKASRWNDVIHTWWYELAGIFLFLYNIYTRILHKKEIESKKKIERLKGNGKVNKVLFFAQT